MDSRRRIIVAGCAALALSACASAPAEQGFGDVQPLAHLQPGIAANTCSSCASFEIAGLMNTRCGAAICRRPRPRRAPPNQTHAGGAVVTDPGDYLSRRLS